VGKEKERKREKKKAAYNVIISFLRKKQQEKHSGQSSRQGLKAQKATYKHIANNLMCICLDQICI